MSRSVIERIRDDLVAGVAHYERRRRRTQRRPWRVVATLVLVVGTAVVWNARGEDSRVIVGPASSGPLAGSRRCRAARAGLRNQGPLPGGARSGREASCSRSVRSTMPGLSYPWRSTRAPRRGGNCRVRPSRSVRALPAVWTGEELIICCGGAPEARPPRRYNPKTDRVALASRCSGRRLRERRLDRRASHRGLGGRRRVARTLSWQWTMLPAPSTWTSSCGPAWTGSEMVVWPSPPTRTVSAGESFDPLTNRWTAPARAASRFVARDPRHCLARRLARGPRRSTGPRAHLRAIRRLPIRPVYRHMDRPS